MAFQVFISKKLFLTPFANAVIVIQGGHALIG